MSQEMNQLPIRHSATSSTVSTIAGAAGGALKGAAKGALIGAALIFGLPLAGAIIGGLTSVGALAGLGIGLIPAATVAVGGGLALGLGWLGLNVPIFSIPLGIAAAAFGALGLAKGAEKAQDRVQQQSANANVLDAQLQAAAMDAQARVAQAQAQAYAPQPRIRHAVPETMHAASPQIMASNDNEHHGTVAHAPERQVGHA